MLLVLSPCPSCACLRPAHPPNTPEDLPRPLFHRLHPSFHAVVRSILSITELLHLGTVFRRKGSSPPQNCTVFSEVRNHAVTSWYSDPSPLSLTQLYRNECLLWTHWSLCSLSLLSLHGLQIRIFKSPLLIIVLGFPINLFSPRTGIWKCVFIPSLLHLYHMPSELLVLFLFFIVSLVLTAKSPGLWVRVSEGHDLSIQSKKNFEANTNIPAKPFPCS